MVSRKLSAILIDDESNALKVLNHLLSITGKVNVVAQEINPNLGLKQIVTHKPDLVFLDVNIPNKDGITLLKEINELKLNVRVIIVSAYDKYVFEAFKNSAIDFLLKPIVLDQLVDVLDRVQLSEKQNLKKIVQQLDQSHKLKFSSGGKILLLAPEQIFYLSADGNYTNLISTEGKEHIITTGLGKLESILPNNFLKISRSIIINTQHLSGLIKGKKLCILSCNGNDHYLKASSNGFYELESRFI